MVRSLILAVVLMTSTSIARAEDEAGRSKAATELASAVLSPAQYSEMLDQIVAVTVQSVQAEASASNKALPADFQQKFRTEMEKLLPYKEMLDIQSSLLAKYYTASEIDKLAVFYKSAVGQKAIKVMPAVMADAMVHVQGKLQRDLPGAVQRIFSSEPAEQPAPPTKTKKKSK